MERSWLAVTLLAMSSTGCLITSPPQFTAQGHTAPFLVEATASPDPRKVVVVDGASFNDLPFGSFPFSAGVISQDDPTGPFSLVSAWLYIDYGSSALPGQPYYFAIQGNTLLQPGTLDQTTGRQLSATWQVPIPDVSHGCHTATLVASHHFDQPPLPDCWSCEDDFSMLTWQVLRCDTSTSPDDCNALPLVSSPGSTACPVQTNPGNATTCEQIHAHQDGGPTCASLGDGGAP